MTAPPPPSDPVVWRGNPSPRAQLPTFAALLLGAIVATAAIVFLGRESDAGDGDRSLGPLVPWLVAFAWLVCAAAALGVYLRSRSTRYALTTERLRVTTGLLSTTTQEMELRRVRDTVVLQPLFLRMMGLGHVALVSADASTPRVTLAAVPAPEQLQSTIRELVHQAYRGGAARELDVF